MMRHAVHLPTLRLWMLLMSAISPLQRAATLRFFARFFFIISLSLRTEAIFFAIQRYSFSAVRLMSMLFAILYIGAPPHSRAHGLVSRPREEALFE